MLRPRYYTTYFDSGVKQLQLLAVLYDTPCTTFGLRTGDDAGGVHKAQLPGEDRRGPGGPGQRSWMMVRGVAQICCSPAKLVHGPMCRLCRRV